MSDETQKPDGDDLDRMVQPFEQPPDSGVDYDLRECLDWNPIEVLPEGVESIRRVCAVVEGTESLDYAWHWVIERNDGAYVYLVVNHEYTPWSESWPYCEEVYSTLTDLIEAIVLINSGQRKPDSDYYTDPVFRLSHAVDLLVQLVVGRKETWREQLAKALKADEETDEGADSDDG